MAWNGDTGAIFAGASGQMAVIGEIMHRKCNAAIPHADVGTDVFAFLDDREEVARIQVKTALGQKYKKGEGYSADFRIGIKQLKRTDSPPLFYAFATRLDDGWGSFIVISRSKLQKLFNAGCGYKNGQSKELELHIQYRLIDKVPDAKAEGELPPQTLTAMCGDFELTEYLNAWESLPPLKPIAAIDAR